MQADVLTVVSKASCKHGDDEPAVKRELAYPKRRKQWSQPIPRTSWPTRNSVGSSLMPLGGSIGHARRVFVVALMYGSGSIGVG